MPQDEVFQDQLPSEPQEPRARLGGGHDGFRFLDRRETGELQRPLSAIGARIRPPEPGLATDEFPNPTRSSTRTSSSYVSH